MESDKETNPIRPEIQRSAIVMGCPTIFPAGSVCGQVVRPPPVAQQIATHRSVRGCLSPQGERCRQYTLKLPMATRDIYETGFDEDVQTNSSTNPCPECDGRVTTNAIETICEDCGLVIDEQRIDHGPEWRTHDQDQRKRTGAPLTAARHDRGLDGDRSRERCEREQPLGKTPATIPNATRTKSRSVPVKAERNLAHGLGEVRRISGALELSTRCAIRRVSCSERTE